MRVVVVSPFPPQRDGIGDYAARLVRSYENAGHAVAVVPIRPTNVSARPITRIPLLPWQWLRAFRAVRSWRPDLVHVQHTVATYGVRLPALWTLVAALRRSGTPVVVTHHEVTRDIDRLGQAGAVYYRITSRLASKIHVHTVASAQALQARAGVTPDKVVVRPHPVYDLPEEVVAPADLRRRHGLEDAAVLLVFGYIHVEKGLRETVDAVGALLARRPDLRRTLRVVIAGDVRPRPAGFQRFEQADREYLALVHAQVSVNDLDDVVRFTGHVPDGEVATWFRLADLVLLPYVATEQSGVANLAIAAGTPVLPTRVGGLAELFPAQLPSITSLAAEPYSRSLETAVDDLSAVREAVRQVYVDLREVGGPTALVDAVTRSVLGTVPR